MRCVCVCVCVCVYVCVGVRTCQWPFWIRLWLFSEGERAIERGVCERKGEREREKKRERKRGNISKALQIAPFCSFSHEANRRWNQPCVSVMNVEKRSTV